MKRESIPCSLHRATGQPGENKLLVIIGISLVTMVGEIIGGTLFGSMALLADGWHMGTHVLALGIAYGTCLLARRIVTDRRFGFGAIKVSALGGFAGAILLGFVAFEMVGEGIRRLLEPETIRFTEAIIVAVIGLAVNTVGAFLLHEGAHAGEHHGHEHHHRQRTGVHGHDANMRSAYLHVITDALTSVLTIVALFLGKKLGWVWADAAAAILGGVIILKWAYGLLSSTSMSLLDYIPNTELHEEVERTIEGEQGNQIDDLHIWPQGNHYGLLATVTAHSCGEKPSEIHQRLEALGYLDHITIEVRPCDCC